MCMLYVYINRMNLTYRTLLLRIFSSRHCVRSTAVASVLI